MRAIPIPRWSEFVKKYKERYDGKVPDAMAVTGYDAANIMFDAIERAKSTDGPAIREALATTRDFPARHRLDHHRQEPQRHQAAGGHEDSGRQIRAG